MRALLLLIVAACGAPTPLPKGPPPEYEEDPVPAAITPDAGTSTGDHE